MGLGEIIAVSAIVLVLSLGVGFLVTSPDQSNMGQIGKILSNSLNSILGGPQFNDLGGVVNSSSVAASKGNANQLTQQNNNSSDQLANLIKEYNGLQHPVKLWDVSSEASAPLSPQSGEYGPGAGGGISLYLENTGKAAYMLRSVYVNGTQLRSWTFGDIAGLNSTVFPGKIGILRVPNDPGIGGYFFNSSKVYEVSFIDFNGERFDFYLSY